MSGLRLKNEEAKQAKRDTEQAEIIFFRDVPTLRKLIAAFEGDLRQDQEEGRDTPASSTLGLGDQHTRR